MLCETSTVQNSRQSLKALHSDLDRIEQLLQRTDKDFIETRSSAWERARAATAIYIANFKIHSRFTFWLLPD